MDCQVGVMVSVHRQGGVMVSVPGFPGGCDGECAWIVRWV